MRSSMRTITDVSYDNRTVDCEAEGLAYTINSDHISYIISDYYDIDTHAHSVYTLGDGITTDYKRGRRITVSMASRYTAGHDYMGVLTIFQRQAGDMSEETSTGAYDVYMGAGKLQDDSETATEVYIDKDISFIRSPVWKSNNTVLCGGCVLRLSDRDLLITAYNPTTGKATVTGAKINGTTSTTRTTSKGESYKLITNYLTCDAFTFSYRTTPTIGLTCTLTTDGIEAVGSYEQAQGTEIRSWRMWAKYNRKYVSTKLTITHEENFSLDIEDLFPPLASKGYGEIPDNPEQVTVYLEVTTQDEVTVQTYELLELSASYPLTVTDITSNGNGLVTGLPANGTCFVYRQRLGLGIGAAGSYKYIGEGTYGVDPTGFRIHAHENGFRETYKYIICGIDEDGYIYYGESAEFSNPKRVWELSHITKRSDGTYSDDGYYYTFNVDVNPSQIETVVGSTVYSTEGRFPKNVHGSDRYETGSFTAVLGSISYPEATANTIEGWTEFITQGGLFMLKTENGDVKIVTITGNPSRQYGTLLAELGLTRVTYTWAEVLDINEVYFV